MGDTKIALEFKGKWTGKWSIGEHEGDFILVITDVKGRSVTGEAFWYNTASLAPNEPLEKAVVSDGVLCAQHPSGVKLRLQLVNGQLSGTWKFSRYKGTLQAARDDSP